MTVSMIFLFLSMKLIIMADASESQIKFQPMPSVIHPVLTKNFTLICSVREEYDYDSISLYSDRFYNGKISPAPAKQRSSIYHVTAILVGKVNKSSGLTDPVASVSAFSPAAVESKVDSSLVKAVGACNESLNYGEIGYLQVTWEHPLEENAGEFVCEVVGLGKKNHPVSLNSTLSVTSSQPAINDVVSYVSKQDRLIDELQRNVGKISASVETLELNFSVAPPVTLQELGAQNIQKGNGSCSYGDLQRVKISFPKTYESAPLVFVSVTSVRRTSSVFNDGFNINGFNITISSVNVSSFSVDCSLNYNTYLTFDWLAIDNYGTVHL